MQPLSTVDLPSLWERGSGLHPLDQGLLALSEAMPEVLPEKLADWPLGQRNRALIELYCLWFGSRFEAWTGCAHCGDKMEFAIDGRELISQQRQEQLDADGTITVKKQKFRLPSSFDLAEVIQKGDYTSAMAHIVARCRLDTDGCPAYSREELDEIEDQMARADPLAEIRIALRCPSCGREWDESFDVSGFLWAKICARAKRLLWETHILASAYGWAEKEILSMSDARRATYLELVQA